MTANEPTAGVLPDEHTPGLPQRVLEIRARLGGAVTPEQVAAELRATSLPNTSDEDVRQLWDEARKS